MLKAARRHSRLLICVLARDRNDRAAFSNALDILGALRAAQVAIRKRSTSFRDKLGRCVAGYPNSPDRRRKAMTALTAKARVAHAVMKSGTEYRSSSNGRARDESPLSAVP